MEKTDYGTDYNNFKDLADNDKELAEDLLTEFGKGEWQYSQLFVYEDTEIFAEYELIEGWYGFADKFGDGYNDLNEKDFGGAPNPIRFMDLQKLGEALINSWDASCHYKTESGEIVVTNFGWQ